MKKIVPAPPHLFRYLTLSPNLTPETARTEADALMTCLHQVLDLYFDSAEEDQRQTLINTSLYLSQLLQPLTRHAAGAQP
ncbi:hypothetical protein KSS94_03590 [Pseudomonas fakonensis]|uniref:DUF3077 domain-containing protein n=1 Tax=Pseudomonas fakonensis TaxID=2842355 RepID=A0ABX8NA27_9PSED|nr:hypothetical protein [Pseudomonas fakonensis]QXH52233.1 hypothetical protein KSS94_03590 [Pseudomonas fakonensis]